MVQFGHQLQANAVVEWQKYYLNYSKLKILISGIVTEIKSRPATSNLNSTAPGQETSLLSASLSPPPNSSTSSSSSTHSPSFSNQRTEIEFQFVKSCEDEANKVDEFFTRKISECKERLELLRTVGTGISNDHVAAGRAALYPRRSRVQDLSLEEGSPGSGRQRALSISSDASDSQNRTTSSITRAFTELYREACLLENFAVLNYTGFIKITKKFRKMLGKATGGASSGKATSRAVMSDAKSRAFAEHEEHLKPLLTQLEVLYARNFASGDRSIARALLLVKQKPRSDWYMFRLGLHAGMLVMLLFWVIWQNLSPMSDSVEALLLHPALPVFRLCACAVLLQWCWGLNIYVWKHARINYIFLFGLDPENTFTHEQVFYDACNNTILFLFTVLVFGKLRQHAISFGDIAPGILPLFLLVFLIARFLQSTGFLFSSRGGGQDGMGSMVIPELCHVIASPIYPVTFMSAYLGDLLTSLVKPLLDAAYSVCYFSSGSFLREHNTGEATPRLLSCTESRLFVGLVVPVLCFLPLWLRMLQNLRVYWDTQKRWPAMGNAMKYAVSHFVVLFGALHPAWRHTDYARATVYEWAWIFSYLVATLYAFTWDIAMDWGLCKQADGLRPQLMFGKKRYYYIAALVDMFGRFVWCLTLMPGVQSLSHFLHTSNYHISLFLFSCLGPIEICRRCVWSWLRLEHEHLHNTQGFRRVNFIPLHFETPVRQWAKKTHTPVSGSSVAVELLVVLCIVLAVSMFAANTSSFHNP